MVNFYLFVIMSIFLIILPGPDNAISTKNTLTAGKTGGIQTMFGTCCALLIHTTAAVAGLSAIIVKSALLFSVFKYVGAVYLVYLGFKSLWGLKHKQNEGAVKTVSGSKYENKSCFKQGFLTNLLNPKVAVFFLTFLPQFVDRGSNTLLPFLLMGIIYTLLTGLWFLFYIYLLDRIHNFMTKSTTQKIIEGLTGTVLISFGIKLALAKA